MVSSGNQRSSRGNQGSSRTVSAHREANRPYPKRPMGRGRSRRRLVRAPGRLRVPPPRTYRPTTSPIRRYRPIRRCTRRRSGLHRSRRRLHRCGRTDDDASPPPDEGGNHLMSDSLDEGFHSKRRIPSTTSCSFVIRGHQRSPEAINPPPPAHPSSEVIRGHQRSSEVIRGHQRPSIHLLLLIRHRLRLVRRPLLAARHGARAAAAAAAATALADARHGARDSARNGAAAAESKPAAAAARHGA